MKQGVANVRDLVLDSSSCAARARSQRSNRLKSTVMQLYMHIGPVNFVISKLRVPNPSIGCVKILNQNTNAFSIFLDKVPS